MKIIRTLLLILLAILAILLIAALFVRKEYTITREVSVNKPQEEVYQYLTLLKNQDYFSVWNQADPNMKRDFVGTDGTVGAISKWEGNKEVGKGEQEITGLTPPSRIDMQLRFYEPMEMSNEAYFTTTLVDSNTTKVLWGFDGRMSYPMNLTLLLMDMDGMLGPDLEMGLSNLKSVLEKPE